MAAAVLRQEGSKRAGNGAVLNWVRQPSQFNASVKVQCSLLRPGKRALLQAVRDFAPEVKYIFLHQVVCHGNQHDVL